MCVLDDCRIAPLRAGPGDRVLCPSSCCYSSPVQTTSTVVRDHALLRVAVGCSLYGYVVRTALQIVV